MVNHCLVQLRMEQAPGVQSGIRSFDGGTAGLQATAEATNLNNTGSDIKAILIDTNGHTAETAGEIDSLENYFRLLLHR